MASHITFSSQTSPLARGRGLMIASLMGIMLAGAAARAEKAVMQVYPWEWRVVDMDELAAQAKGVQKTPFPFNGVRLDASVVFLDVDNNSNIGFDDPTSGGTRRATFMAMLGYLDSILADTAQIRIEIKQSVNLPGSLLATGGTFFINLAGFYPGTSNRQIVSGIDQFPSSEHVFMTFDFVDGAFTWNDDTGTPGPTEFDLFTVALHEFTHGLGFASLASASGESAVGGDIYTTLDDRLETGNGLDLWSGLVDFNGTAANLIGSANGIRFNGNAAIAAFGAKPPIHAGNPFALGTSLAHTQLGISGGSVMEPSVTAGFARREYTAVDKGILTDLGYSFLTPTPIPTPSPIPTPTVNAADDWLLFD